MYESSDVGLELLQIIVKPFAPTVHESPCTANNGSHFVGRLVGYESHLEACYLIREFLQGMTEEDMLMFM